MVTGPGPIVSNRERFFLINHGLRASIKSTAKQQAVLEGKLIRALLKVQIVLNLNTIALLFLTAAETLPPIEPLKGIE